MGLNFNKVINIGAVSNILNYPFIQSSQCLECRVKYTSNCKNNIENGFVTIKIVKKDLLHLIVWPIDQKFIFQYGRWRPSWK